MAQLELRDVNRDSEDLMATLQPLIWAWRGENDKGIAFRNTQVEHPTRYAGEFANTDPAHRALLATAGVHRFSVDATGINVSSMTSAGSVQVNGDLGVTGTVAAGAISATVGSFVTVTATTANISATVAAATVTATTGAFSATVSAATVTATTAVLTNETVANLLVTTSETVNGRFAFSGTTFSASASSTITLTATGAISMTTNVGLTLVGSTAAITATSATITATTAQVGPLTVKNATGNVTAFFDTDNIRTVFGSATALSGAANDLINVVNGRSYFASASDNLAIGVRYNATAATVHFGGSNSTTTPDAIVSNSGGTQLARFKNAGNLIVGTATAATGTEAALIQGNAVVQGSITATTVTTTGGVNAGASSAFTGGVSIPSGGISIIGPITVGIATGATTDALFGGGTPGWRAIATTDLPTITQRIAVSATSSSPTTSSTAYSDLSEMTTGTFATLGGDLLALFSGSFFSNGANNIQIGLSLDGGGEVAERAFTPSGANLLGLIAPSKLFTGVSAGNHTIKARWKVGGGTGTAYQTMRDLTVIEIRK